MQSLMSPFGLNLLIFRIFLTLLLNHFKSNVDENSIIQLLMTVKHFYIYIYQFLEGQESSHCSILTQESHCSLLQIYSVCKYNKDDMSRKGYEGTYSINILKLQQFYSLLFTLGRPRRESISVVQGKTKQQELQPFNTNQRIMGKNFYVSKKQKNLLGLLGFFVMDSNRLWSNLCRFCPEIISGFYLVADHNHPFDQWLLLTSAVCQEWIVRNRNRDQQPESCVYIG